MSSVTLMGTEVVYKLIEKHFNNRKPGDTYNEVVASLKDDPEFQAVPGSSGLTNGRATIRSYFEKKYNLEEKLLRYACYGITPHGKHISSREQCFKESIKESAATPEDADFAISMFPYSSSLKETYISNKYGEVVIPEVIEDNRANKNLRQSLKHTVLNFHKDFRLPKKVYEAFNNRLGDFYFVVGKTIKDTKVATEFITKNFHSLSQPAAILLPDQKEILCPNEKEIADSIANSSVLTQNPVRANYLRMAKAFAAQTTYEEKPIRSVSQEAFKPAPISFVTSLDNTVETTGGIDEAIALLQGAKEAGLSVEDYSAKLDKQRQDNEQIRKVQEMMDNLSPELQDQVVAKYLQQRSQNMLDMLGGLFPEEFKQVQEKFTPEN